MGPRLRKAVLVVHVLSSVGWFGSVGAFLALALVGLLSEDRQLVAAVYVGARLVTWWVIVPLGFLALVSGVIQSLGTQWGLVRHYWVLIKLVLTTGSLVLLLVHLRVIDSTAEHRMGAAAVHGADEFDAMRLQLVVDSAAALVVLIVATLLSILKPRGQTPFGQPRLADAANARAG
jgi:hypothetical protein